MAGIGPAHPWNVKVSWVAGSLHPGDFSSGGFDGTYADAGIGRSREGIWIAKSRGIGEVAGIRNCGDDFAARLAEIVDQRVGANSGRIELPESDAPAVRAPLKAIADVEFFFVDPVGGAVDDGVGAVASELRDFLA